MHNLYVLKHSVYSIGHAVPQCFLQGPQAFDLGLCERQFGRQLLYTELHRTGCFGIFPGEKGSLDGVLVPQLQPAGILAYHERMAVGVDCAVMPVPPSREFLRPKSWDAIVLHLSPTLSGA